MDMSILEKFCAYLYGKRRWLAANFLIACTAGIVYAFVILQQEYSATITFLPPSSDGGMGLSALSLMSSAGGLPFSMSQSGATSDQVEVIFNSNALKRRVIDEFDLIGFFDLEDSKNPFGLAVKMLDDYVILKANEKGGFGVNRTLSYDIISYHTSPDTAKLMTDFIFAIMDSTVREISVDKAQRNRVFIERQLTVQDRKMDSLQTVFQEFQQTNKAYDVPEQTMLSLKAYADLRAAAIMNEIRLASLQGEFSTSTPEITQLRRLQRAHEIKLSEFESGTGPNILLSFDQSSRLLPEYASLRRDLEVQNQLFLLLTRELEQARLQEARDVSPLIVIDPSFVPEYKARPKRLFILLAVIFIEHLFFLSILAYFFYVKHVLAKSERFNAFAKSLKQRS